MRLRIVSKVRNSGISPSDSDIYPCSAIAEGGVFPILEIEWKHILQHLESKMNPNSLPFDLVKCQIDFADFPAGGLKLLQINPSCRVRRRKRTMIVPTRIIPVPDDSIYFAEIKKVSLAHIERHFRFSLMTTSFISLLPFSGLLLAFFGAYLYLYGIAFYSETTFFPGFAITVSLASLLTFMWTQLVQHSETMYDAKCRRLENDLIASELRRIARLSPKKKTQ